MEGLLIRDLILPVSGTTSTLARGATLASRWLHEPQQISNQPVGLGFHTLRGGVHLGDLRSSPVCWSCSDMEGFLLRGWDLILPG